MFNSFILYYKIKHFLLVKKILNFIESAFVIVSLLFYTGGLLAVILSGGASQDDMGQGYDTGLIRLIFILIYITTFLLLVLRWKKILYFISRNTLIWLLMGYVAASIFWSVAPEVTFRRLVALNGTTLFGLYLSSRYSIKQQLKILALTFSIAIILSFLFATVVPKYGLMGEVHAGAWRGIYIHKNILAKNMVLSIIVFLLLVIESNKNRLILLLGLCCSVVLLLASTAKSSLANLFIVLIIFLILQLFRLKFTIVLPLLISILIIGTWTNLWVLNNADIFLGFLGKDATLTGRTELWQLTWQSIQEKYWLGYGYGAFWSDGNSEASIISSTLKWIIPHAHSGLFELWANLGLLGVIIYLLGFGTMFIKAIIQVCQNKQLEFFWILIFCVYTILANLAEHTVLRENNIFWILYVSTFFSMGLLRNKKLQIKNNEI